MNTLTLWDKYGKAIIAFLYAVVTVAIPLFTGDDHIDPSEGIIIAIAIGNNLLVYIIPLSQRFGGAKSVINAVLAAVAVAQTVIAGGIDTNDWYLIASAFLVAIGVTLAPAASPINNAMVTAGSDTAQPI